MDATTHGPGRRRIKWINVSTVLSATILIGAEVFGGAFAGSWVATVWFGDLWGYIAQAVLFLGGVAIMVKFIRNAQQVEPFTTRD